MLAFVTVEKSIITVILTRSTTLGAFFLSLMKSMNSYEVYEFNEFSLWSFSSKPAHNDFHAPEPGYACLVFENSFNFSNTT